MAGVKRAYPPTAEDMAYVQTANGLAPVVVTAEEAGIPIVPSAPVPRVTEIASPAADTELVPATTNRLNGVLTYYGTGELRITLDGRAASAAHYDKALFNGDELPLTGRTLAIRGIDIAPNGFVRAYEELSS